MRLLLHRPRLVLFGSSAVPPDSSGARPGNRVAGTGRIRRFVRIGTLVTVIAVRPRWRPLLAGIALVVFGVIERQGTCAVAIFAGLPFLWHALLISGDTDADRQRRAQLKRELAAYSTPAGRCELIAVLDRYPDSITDEVRDILVSPPMASHRNGIPGARPY
jgi:hypothetical protein